MDKNWLKMYSYDNNIEYIGLMLAKQQIRELSKHS